MANKLHVKEPKVMNRVYEFPVLYSFGDTTIALPTVKLTISVLDDYMTIKDTFGIHAETVDVDGTNPDWKVSEEELRDQQSIVDLGVHEIQGEKRRVTITMKLDQRRSSKVLELKDHVQVTLHSGVITEDGNASDVKYEQVDLFEIGTNYLNDASRNAQDRKGKQPAKHFEFKNVGSLDSPARKDEFKQYVPDLLDRVARLALRGCRTIKNRVNGGSTSMPASDAH